MKTNCENTKLSDSAFVRLIGEIILIKHYNHLIIMSIKSNVQCHGMSNVKWQKQHEMSCNLRSLSPMSWCLGSQWRDKNSSSPERRAGGGEKPCGVMTMSHHCHNVQCPVSTPVMSIVQCPVVIVSVIESSHSQDSAACYEERERFKCAPSLDLWLLSSTVVSNVMSSILCCPINILSNERVVYH